MMTSPVIASAIFSSPIAPVSVLRKPNWGNRCLPKEYKCQLHLRLTRVKNHRYFMSLRLLRNTKASPLNQSWRLQFQVGKRKFSAVAAMSNQNGESKNGTSITNWAGKDGSFQRQQSQFRNFISKEPGAEFAPEKDRYHLYVSYACPWAHRALIVRKLKGLEEIIPFTSVHWHMLEKGWRFIEDGEKVPGENVTKDPLHPDFTHLRDIYFSANREYSGRFTVPTLYDKKTKTIVSNESAEIIRMFYTEFDELLPEKYRSVDLFPAALQQQIEATNEWTYHDVNNGVYKSGFASSQEAYEKAVHQLFASLDRIEAHLAQQHAEKGGPFYFGAEVTEADVRLYTTIVRFDCVYVQHFKCNVRDIRSGYPHLHRWLRNLYWNVEAFGSTTQFEHIKNHYTRSHKQINPFSITPVGPVPDILALDDEVPAVKAAVKAKN